MKKEWNKPQLVIVVRGVAEENVLDTSKTNVFSGPTGSLGNCNTFYRFARIVQHSAIASPLSFGPSPLGWLLR
jgi:hypothetical protein